MTEREWTEAQLDSIRSTGESLLVSAAAGSGKTAVLAERCAYLVCEAPERCDIDELLVVTYTQAAAAEMRGRIEAALRKRQTDPPDARLARQLLLINRAQISTLHSFCNKVLRQHFHSVGLDPNFRLLTEDEARLLRRDIGTELLESRHERDSDGTFQSLVELHAGGDDKRLLRYILQTHNLLGSLRNREAFLTRSIEQIRSAVDAESLGASGLGADALKLITSAIVDLGKRARALLDHCKARPGAEKYVAHVNDLILILRDWHAAAKSGNFNALSDATCGLKLPTLPVVKDQPDLKDSINELKEAMKEGSLRDLCGFSENDWREGLRRILPATELLIELVREFDKRFSRAKREQRSLDFTDLERMTLTALREGDGDSLLPSNIARAYQSQFRYVLVDEYQDVNEVQDAILHLLSRESSVGAPGVKPNLFSVGDVKQSIYRFRLAEPQRFLDRYDRLSETQPNNVGRVIDLAQNFRSRGGLLDTLNGIFDRLMTRESSGIDYAAAHRLTAGATFPPAILGTSHVELHLLPTEPGDPNDPEQDVELERVEREAAFVAHQIRSLLDAKHLVSEKSASGDPVQRPMKLSDCVILLRSMKFKSESFSAILRNAGISTHSDSSTGFFESQEIRDMLSLLRLLENQQQDIPMAAVLRSPISGLLDVDDLMATIRLMYPNADQTPFHAAVVAYRTRHEPLNAFLNQLDGWRTKAHMQPLADVIWHIYDCTGYLAFTSGLPDGAQRVANLLDLHARAREFGGFHRQGLTRFMSYLTELEDETDLGQPSAIGAADDAVRIMSIHRSKGLEFPIVFVPDLGKLHNLADAAGSVLIDRNAGIGMMVPDPKLRVQYPSLVHMLAKHQIRKATLTEELRVLYVALTRAKEQLYLVGTIDPAQVERKVEAGRAHIQALPVEATLSARTTLDWLLPVAGSMSAARFEPPLAVVGHEADEVGAWCSATSSKRTKTEIWGKLARLEPIEAPPLSSEAERVVDRLTWVYPHKPLTKTAAVESVGSLSKSADSAPAAPVSGYVAEPTRELEPPKFTLTTRRVAAVDVGTATHRVLELLHFQRASDADSIRKQIAQFIDRQLITADAAADVDTDAIAWFVATPLGREIAKTQNLRREVSIYYPLEAAVADPLDRIMVRGRIDLMFQTDAGLKVIDFKTDRIDADGLPNRVERYRPQVQSYRQALTDMTGQAVESVSLVFLTPRVVVTVS